MENPRLKVAWADDFLRINAVFELPGGRKENAGYVQGSVETPVIGFLSDIHVENQIEVRTGLFNLSKKTVSARGQGIGSDLLECFEREMREKGVVEIHGNLTPEVPDKQEWLIRWYQERGYEFHPGESVGAFVPPHTIGVVTKRIS